MARLVSAPIDLATGILLAGLGTAALWIGWDWPAGSLAEMQAGFFPRLLAAALVLGGLALIGRSVLTNGEPMPRISWRPVLGVTAAVIAFALTLERLGLVIAILTVVVIGSTAGAGLRPLPLLLLWLVLTVLCGVIFVWGVGLPIQLAPF
ncbi:hypothetical protein STAQ_43320 [Allostella sp. ATCC 35155]|nr:hypothetical protein STAQ_43320 [Stella sp. ATCC 35155]